MRTTIKRLAVGSSLAALYIACSADQLPQRGGLMLTVSAEAALELDEIRVAVTSKDTTLIQKAFPVPQTPLPNTLSIVTNGSETGSATIVVSGWKNRVPLDRRDAIVTQIPVDRVAALEVVLAAVCKDFTRLSSDGTSAESTCAPGFTCGPAVGACVPAGVDASSLPSYDGAAGGQPDGGGGAVDPDSGAPVAQGCTTNEECAPALATTTPADCATATCDPATRKCIYKAKDGDGDGVPTKDCKADNLTIEVGTDCDDADKTIYPGAWDGPEDASDAKRAAACEGKDNDCSGKADDAKSSTGAVCTCIPKDKRACAETPEGTAFSFPGGEPAPGSTCKRGEQVCTDGGAWGPCLGAVAPKARDCSVTEDADCDGTADNKIDGVCTCAPTSTRTCFPYAAPAKPNNGPCRNGSQACQKTANGSTWSSCSGMVGPTGVDTCNAGNDNNCDGNQRSPNGVPCACTNNETRGCALGCGNGTSTCRNGQYSACEGVSGPAVNCDQEARNNTAFCYGSKSCQSNGQLTGCNVNTAKYCPGGYSDIGNNQCRRIGMTTRLMRDQGGDGFDYGRWGMPFTPVGSGPLSTTMSFSYGGRTDGGDNGGCWNGDSPDALTLACQNLAGFAVTQCQAGAPSCGGQTFNTNGSTYCDIRKLKGWTPGAQGTCHRTATMTVTHVVPKGCY